MSAPSLCVACWRLSAPADALYRCPACAGAGSGGPAWLSREGVGEDLRPVRRLRRPWYRNLLRDDARPRCPRHGEAELELFCVCGHRLTARAASRRGRPLGFGFAGPPGSGKTLLLIATLRALRQDSDRDAAGALGALGVDGTEERFHALAGAFLADGSRPHATVPEPDGHDGGRSDAGAGAGDGGNFCWELFVGTGAGTGVGNGARGRAPILLSVFDLAGETWGAAPSARLPRLDRYLSLLGSLIFLVDGAAIAADLGAAADDAWDRRPRPGDSGAADLALLTRLIDRLGTRARRLDLALVVSKSDLLWDLPGREALRPSSGTEPEGDAVAGERAAAIDDLLRETGRGDLLAAARAHCRRVRLFACSSLGFRPGDDDVADGRLLRPMAPQGVIEPLRWLLAQRIAGLEAQ